MSDDVVQALGPERATALLLELWAIEGTLSPLPSYEDENHRVKSDAGEFVFRISHPRTTRSSLETQNRAMQAVAAALPGRCPSVVSSRNDREFEEVSSSGETRLCRLLRFIPGRTWAEARPHPLGRHRQLGEFERLARRIGGGQPDAKITEEIRHIADEQQLVQLPSAPKA